MSHDLAEYLLENYRRGVTGEPHLPGSAEPVNQAEAVQALRKILPGEGVVNGILREIERPKMAEETS